MQSLSEKANKFLVCGVLSAAVLLGCGASARAAVVPAPNQPVAGQSQLALAQQWTQWALGILFTAFYALDGGNDFKSIQDGYWLALENLAPGSHTLAFGGGLVCIDELKTPQV